MYGAEKEAENSTPAGSAAQHENAWKVSHFSSSDSLCDDWLPVAMSLLTITTEVITERCSTKQVFCKNNHYNLENCL